MWKNPVVWQPDADAPDCRLCGRKFSLTLRRHHCRTCGRVVCNSCSTNRMRKPKITGYAGKVRVCDDCWESFAPNHLHRKSTETSGRKDQTSPRHTEPRKLQAVDEHTAMLRLDDPNDRESYTQWNTSGIDLEKALSERRRDRKASLNTWWAYWRRICCFMCRSRQIVHAQPGCCSCCCADHGILHGMTLENDEEENSDPEDEPEGYSRNKCCTFYC